MLYIISTTFHLSVTVANDCFHKCEFYRIWKHRNLFIFILLCMKYFCQVLQASLHKQRIQNILKTIDGSGSLLWTLDSVQSVVSDSLQPHWQQHSRLPCPSPIPGAFQTHVHWLSDAIQPSHPLSFPSSPAFNLSQHQGLFQWVSSLHQVAKVLEFQPQHQSFQWIFRTDLLYDWLFDLHAVQETLKSLFQHHSSKAAILWCSAFFIVQLSHPHMTTGKTTALTRWTFVGKVMSLLFNMLSRF